MISLGVWLLLIPAIRVVRVAIEIKDSNVMFIKMKLFLEFVTFVSI